MVNRELIEIRKKIIEKDFSRMNSMQFEAVTTVDGPLLILAGAGSGKTTVIVNRISNLIKYGNAYNSDVFYDFIDDTKIKSMQAYLDGDSSVYYDIKNLLKVDAPKPWQILAITFTNKAANELKERLTTFLGDEGDDIWACTFHSACVRILRKYSDRIGFSSHFTIYDTDDSKRVIKDCQKSLGIDEKYLSCKSVLNAINDAKDSLISPDEYKKNSFSDIRKEDIAKIYSLYQQRLKKADAMDFDDIIYYTVELLKKDKEVLEYYQNRFKYIMVDEYQDTNHAQYVFVSLLASLNGNICVVGDDDQSIYSFRGANIENILSFEKQFNNSKVIRLEENYRSTQTILDAANAVISNNEKRKGKNLWTSNDIGEKIVIRNCYDDIAESQYVAKKIMEYAENDVPFSSNAILYRTNSQSNNMERALVKSGIPYRIIGGHRFYDRKEIKDALAYLAVVSNPNDTVRLRRIINEPKRGIGETTVNNLIEISLRIGEDVFDLMEHSDEYSVLSRSSNKLKLFSKMINYFSLQKEKNSIAQFFRIVMNESGYIESLNNDEKKDERIENLDELYSTIVRYEEENGDNASLEGFLEEVSLLSDIDNYDTQLDVVTMMTLHSSKGLEFPMVYILGMENGLFPAAQSMLEPILLEEERRLAYVGITRAKKKLFLLRAQTRMQYGKTTSNPPSVFISEIPISLIDMENDSYTNSYNYNTGFSNRYNNTYNNHQDTYNYLKNNIFEMQKNTMDNDNLSQMNNIDVFSKGDNVYHKKFGKGLVLSTVSLGNDIMLEVAFEAVGTKKLMQKMARLEKI